MKTAHTPGPWRVGDAGKTVFGPKNGNPSPKTIAHVYQRADAKAIAALPELLGAILLLEKSASALLLHDNVTYNMKARALDQSLLLVRAAIAKATGGQP